MDPSSIVHLSELLRPAEDAASESVAFSHPGQIGGPQGSAQPQRAAAVTKRDTPATGDIWTADEVDAAASTFDDSRERPQFSVRYGIRMASEDAFLGRDLGRQGMDDDMVVTIDLPAVTSMSELALDVQPRSLILSSARYFLHLPLEKETRSEQGRATFYSDKKQLRIVLPLQP